ncbi:MAG: oligosaccharide flippase family protein [Lentisphaeria bacterium]
MASYTQCILGAGLALFSSRWILNALGQSDFGLYAIVGSLIVFVSFFNSALASSAIRHLAFAIGKGDSVEVNKWFNTAVTVHIMLPAILVFFGWPVGEYCIHNVLTIPPERVHSCVLVFRFSLISTFIVMSCCPFLAMFAAKQRITETAMWGIFMSVLTFILAYVLTRMPGDRLVFYAAGMVCISSLITITRSIRAVIIFPECQLIKRYWFDYDRARKLLSFATWNLIGSLGGLFRGQGTAILLNLFHGPKANAAYGIANQLSTQALSFTQSVNTATSPEIIVSSGRGEHERLFELSLRTSKFGTLLAMFFVIPLFFEANFILTLWLKSPPPHTSLFCQIILMAFLVDTLTIGHALAINANGKIAIYQATIGTILIFTFPLGYLLLKLFHVPATAVAAILITNACGSIARIYWGQRLLGLSTQRWATGVLSRCLSVAMPATAMAAIPCLFFPPSLLRLALCILHSSVTIAIFGWLVALTASERAYFLQSKQKIISKFRSFFITV